MEIIESILLEFEPCSITELLDYLRSDFFLQKGNYSSQEWTYSKIRYYLDKITQEHKKIFKFECKDGFKVRYGRSKFNYYLLEEPRYLKVQGYLKRCMFCGMPIYVKDSRLFHFKYQCKQYQPQECFKLLKVSTFWAIISRDYVYGILDDLYSCSIRLPDINRNDTNNEIFSELWLINEKARGAGIIEKDRLLTLKPEEILV